MNRNDLIDELSQRFAGNREVAAHALDSVVDVITKSVSAGEKVVITGFGEFERRLRSAGAKAGEYVPEFKPGKELRDVVGGVREWRGRVSDSLALVPATAAEAAEQASRATAGTLRTVAEKARELAAELASIGEPARGAKPVAAKKAAGKAPAAKKTPARKAPAVKRAAAKAAVSPAKKSPARKAPARKAPARKAPAAKKSTAKKRAKATPSA